MLIFGVLTEVEIVKIEYEFSFFVRKEETFLPTR